jgi:2-oxoglutarate dehydrogenase complex dehydrogenase (E1) component-like enzyme
MQIILLPCASNKTTTVSISGLTVTIDGTEYDLSAIPEGGQAEASENSPFIGIVTREKVTIRYEYDMTTAEDDQSTDWSDYTFDVASGDVPCPIKWRVAE